jgi:hypothetical protein
MMFPVLPQVSNVSLSVASMMMMSIAMPSSYAIVQIVPACRGDSLVRVGEGDCRTWMDWEGCEAWPPARTASGGSPLKHTHALLSTPIERGPFTKNTRNVPVVLLHEGWHLDRGAAVLALLRAPWKHGIVLAITQRSH